MDRCRSSFFSLSRFFYFIIFSLCALPLQAHHYYRVSLSGADQKKGSAIYIRTVKPLNAAWFPENAQIDIQSVQRPDIDLSTSYLFIFDGGITPHEMDDHVYSSQSVLAIRAVLLTMADRRFQPAHRVTPFALPRGNQQDLAVPVYQYGNLARNLNDIGGLAEQLQQEGLIVDWHFRGLSFIDEARIWVRIRVSVNGDNSIADHHQAVLERFRHAFPSMAIRHRLGLSSSREFERAEPVSRGDSERSYDHSSVSSTMASVIQFYLNAEGRLAVEDLRGQVLGCQLYTFLVRFHVSANELSSVEPPWLSNIINFTNEVCRNPFTNLLRWMLVRISRDAVRDGHLVLTFRVDIAADPYEVSMALLTRSESVSAIHLWSQMTIDLLTTGPQPVEPLTTESQPAEPQPQQGINPGCLERLIRLFGRLFRQRQSWQPEELQPLPANPQLVPARALHGLDQGSGKMQ